ncbi:hypothetical protein ZHAS_00019168 [Anopheles sinensis]|uniref:Uncharacterized protein n=1 Tax=Anopheles sinensis TaxID=74873 RepID=A0A084WLL5_ANOSI|nr:hypothetical protein ZHAS_00019168 [Anopheles sinensis]
MKYVVAVFFVVFCSLRLSAGGFVECDLDLDDPRILKQLPEECQNVDEASRVLLLKETESFKEFHRKLSAYEASKGLNTDDAIYMDMDFRRELYTAAGLHECLDIEESLEEYVQCLVAKRAQMITSIDGRAER